ncbi:unnamed protein product [Meloidogyne enterolobii]|uniref:Uncharacterized protein n=1 Tax=Meloidogyne enterolobii TaxID=390850 RepID=A0ACB0Z086_MELEN
MVLDKELQLDLVEHAAMLQNKAMIQNNVLAKRKQQLEHWENSEMNQICPKRNHYQLSKVKFQNSDIFLSACQSGDEDEVEELLKKGSDINSSNIDGVTALHQAVIDGNMDIVRFLVQHNADINAQDNEGWTPLHTAVCCGNLNIAKYLYENNADLACVNSDRELPVDLAENDEMRNFLEEVMRLKEVDERKARESEFNAMLEDCDRWIQSGKCLDTPHPKTGATALHVAASKGYVQLIGLFFIFLNVFQIFLQFLEKLINAGADINAPDFEGWTPLHAAAHWGEREACRILVENGANFDTLTYFGHSVLSVADKSIEEYLYNLKEEQEKARLDEAAKMSSGEDTNEEEENEKTSINQLKEGSVESGNSNGSNNEEEDGATTEEVEEVQVDEEVQATSATSSSQVPSNSHSNSPSVEENFSSNTGSGISSIQTTSRSVTPKDRSSSLYSSDQSVQCTIRAGVPTTNKSMNLEDRSTSSSPSISTSTSTSLNSNSIAKSTQQQTHQKSAVLRAAEETVKRLRRQLPIVQSTVTRIPLTPLPNERAKSSSVDCGKPSSGLLNVESSPSLKSSPLKSPPSSAPLVQSARLFWNSIENNNCLVPVQQSTQNQQQNLQNHPITSTQLHQQQFLKSRQKFAVNDSSGGGSGGGNSLSSNNGTTQSPFAFVAGEQQKQQYQQQFPTKKPSHIFKRAESLKVVGSSFNNNNIFIPPNNPQHQNQAVQQHQAVQQQPPQQFMLWRQQTVSSSKDLLKDPKDPIKDRKNSVKTTKIVLPGPQPSLKNIFVGETTTKFSANKKPLLPLTAAFTTTISNAEEEGRTPPSESCSSSIAASPSALSSSSMINSNNNFPFVTVRKQSLQQTTPPTQPTSQKESESERKAKSKLKRSTRRSTQGVTLEQLGEAAGHHKSNNNGNYHYHQQQNSGDRIQQANEKFNCFMEVTKENRDVNDELKFLKKTVQDLQLQQQHLKNEILWRDKLIHENGFLVAKQDPNDVFIQPLQYSRDFTDNGIDPTKMYIIFIFYYKV